MSGAETALVIGSTGFLGGHVVAALSEAGFRTLGTSTDGEGADLALDLLDPESVDSAIARADADRVVMAAGMASVSKAWNEPAAAFRLNTGGVLNLLEAMRRLNPGARLLFASSAAVYGRPESTAAPPPFTEKDPLRPESPYAASKAAAEVLCSQYAAQYGLGTTIVRSFNLIGPGLPTAHAPSMFARSIAGAESEGLDSFALPVGNPEAERDFTDVRDAARGIAGLIAAESDGHFNLCSGTTVSLSEIVAGLAASSPVEIEIAPSPELAHRADVPIVGGSNARLIDVTGWRPEISLETSLRDLLEAWRNRGGFTRP